jgi:hypothetical protein
MTQLIINNSVYPEVTRDKYKCYKRDVGESLRMTSGRMVFEMSYQIYVIEYKNDYFKPDLMRQCLGELSPGNSLIVQFLAPESDELMTAGFVCVKRPVPVFAFSREGVPYWHNIEFTLEGVDPIA